MKKIILFLLMLSTLNVFAEVKIGVNPALSQADQKTSKEAVKRAANFYSWYLKFLNTNKERPLQHAIIDQNTTKVLRKKVADNTAEYDIFLASKDLDSNCNLEIIPIKVESGKITLNINVTGKYNYIFHIEMIIQKEAWCLDNIFADKDQNLQVH